MLIEISICTNMDNVIITLNIIHIFAQFLVKNSLIKLLEISRRKIHNLIQLLTFNSRDTRENTIIKNVFETEESGLII